MLDLTTKNNDDINLDRVAEINLTEQQYIRWMSADTLGPDILDTPEGRIVLKDMRPAPKPRPSILMQMGPLADAALGPEWKQRASQQATLPPNPPVPVRKMKRQVDAVWALFCLQFEVPDEDARLHLANQFAAGVVGLVHAFGVLEAGHGGGSKFEIVKRHVEERIKTALL